MSDACMPASLPGCAWLAGHPVPWSVCNGLTPAVGKVGDHRLVDARWLCIVFGGMNGGVAF